MTLTANSRLSASTMIFPRYVSTKVVRFHSGQTEFCVSGWTRLMYFGPLCIGWISSGLFPSSCLVYFDEYILFCSVVCYTKLVVGNANYKPDRIRLGIVSSYRTPIARCPFSTTHSDTSVACFPPPYAVHNDLSPNRGRGQERSCLPTINCDASRRPLGDCIRLLIHLQVH